jgi:hypothetical protein
MTASETQKRKRIARRIANLGHLTHGFELPQQLFFQMPARALFDRASLCRYALLFCLTLSHRSRFYRLRHVPDLRSTASNVLLFWFRVWIHEDSMPMLPVRDEDNRDRCQAKNRGTKRHG